MPVYEYACTECGHRLEARQSFTDEALTICPVCGGRLRKLLSPVGVVFKGSGFYRTDSRGTPPSDGAATESDGAKTAASTNAGDSARSTGDKAPTGESAQRGDKAPSPSSSSTSSSAANGPAKTSDPSPRQAGRTRKPSP